MRVFKEHDWNSNSALRLFKQGRKKIEKKVKKIKGKKNSKKKRRKRNDTKKHRKKHRGNKKNVVKKEKKIVVEAGNPFLRANWDHECIMSAFGSRNFGLMQLEKVKVEIVLCNFSRSSMKAALFSVMNGLQIKE